MNSFFTHKLTHLFLIALLPLNLLGHVQLDYPQGGETFYSGDSIVIQWTEVIHHNTLNWELYYSSDGGVNWQVIDNNIPYEVLEYKWQVPYEETTMGRIKVVQNNEGTNYESESGDFTVQNASGIGQLTATEELFKSVRISPNPSTTSCTLSFNLKQPAQLSVQVYDIVGKQVEGIPKKQYSSGQKEITLNTRAFNAGDYFCVIKTANAGKTLRFQVIR